VSLRYWLTFSFSVNHSTRTTNHSSLFEDNLWRVVSDGDDTYIWIDSWVGDAPLCDRFNRLFDLSENRLLSVADMWQLWLRWGGRSMEVEVEVVCVGGGTLFHNIVLQENVLDRWKWLLDLVKGYSVNDAYHFFTAHEEHGDFLMDNMWHKHVYLKVSLFARCLFRNRLPTKDNLLWCGIIQAESTLCVGGCDMEETIGHLFLSCNYFTSMWHLIRDWLGVSSVELATLLSQFFAI